MPVAGTGLRADRVCLTATIVEKRRDAKMRLSSAPSEMWKAPLRTLSLSLAVAACGTPAAVAPTNPRASQTLDGPRGHAETICAQSPIYPEASTFFSSATVEEANSIDLPGNGDLWPSCASGDVVYFAWGDGFGFTPNRGARRPDIGVARVLGLPWDAANMRGTNVVDDDHKKQSVFRVWTKGPYYQKPTGMLCRGGKMYLAVHDLNASSYDDVPAATIAVSNNGGSAWEANASPMFVDWTFTTIMFIDYGADGKNAVDEYVYAYGLDHNFRASTHVIDPQGLYLARIAADKDLRGRDNWEFFAGLDTGANPTWSRNIADKKAALVDCTRRDAGKDHDGSVISQGGVVYDAPLKRYIYTSWTEYTFEFYEAPAPWGPWRRFLHKDFGPPPWTAQKHGGYATSVPSRYISEDGRTMWVQSNTWSSGVDHNNLALRKLVVTTSSAP